ncbi:MAG: Ig-like domain-containing protein [Nanoarchaeota archaeon]
MHNKRKVSFNSFIFFLVFIISFILLSIVFIKILSRHTDEVRVQKLFLNIEKLHLPFFQQLLLAPTIPTSGGNIPILCPVPSIYSVQNGNWNDPATWNLNRIPTHNDSVNVSHRVTYDAPVGVNITCLNIHGVVNFSRTQNTQLKAGYILVFPEGTLEVGSEGNPIPDGISAEIIIRDVPIDSIEDPAQFGTALIGLGKVSMHGSLMNPTFVRVSQTPVAGATTFSLTQAVTGWKVGDKIFIPDTHFYPDPGNGANRYTYLQLEERTITAISGDGRNITFSPALTYTHPGTTDENADGQPDYLPHIGNLRRNIVIRSESKTGTRGHVLFTGRASVDIRYSAFVDLGRTTFNDLNAVTNPIGRYSLHMHHTMGPAPGTPWFSNPYQFRLVGNAIYENSSAVQPPPQKWGITIHNSHYGLIQDNVVYNLGGSGIVTEDGTESYNLFDHNFVAKISSNGQRIEADPSGRGIGREGVGFWFRGPNNYVRNNVAANMGEGQGDVEASYGFKYQQQYFSNIEGVADLRIPNFQGADTAIAGQYTLRNGYSMNISEFDGNEMYGNVQGLTLWWVCNKLYQNGYSCPISTLRNVVIWNTIRYPFYGYPDSNFDFDGFKVYKSNSAFHYGDYDTANHTLRNSFFYDTNLLGPYFRSDIIRYENNYFRNADYSHRTSAAPGSCNGCDLPDPNTILVNNLFASGSGISMDYYTPGQDVANLDRLIVCNHNRISGDNFEVFFPQKNPPCLDTRLDVSGGYVCVTALADSICLGLPPPDTTLPTVSITTPLNGSIVSNTITVNATASDNVGVAGVQFLIDGANIGSEDLTTPYSILWNSSTTANGNHNLSARARDAAGNIRTSAISVTVDNVLPLPVLTSFSFAAAGDHGWNINTNRSLDMLNASNSSFYLALGDMSYGAAGTETNWCNFIKSRLNSVYPFELISGNHEETGGPNGYIMNFAACLPDRMSSNGLYGAEYYFDVSNLARIIMIAPNLNINGAAYSYTVGNSNYTWLSNTIDSARVAGIPWVIVGMHKNCITAATKSCEIGADLMNLLFNKKVDLILQGHDHVYERSKQLSCAQVNSYNNGCVVDDGSDDLYSKGAGSVLIIDGTFGQSLYDINTLDSEAGYFTKWMGNNINPTFGFTKFFVNSTEVSVQFLNSTGTFTDNFRIINNTLTPIVCTDTDIDGWNATTGGSCGAVDCDDALFFVNPGITEVCNDGIDNNCNSLIDSNDPTCTVPVTCIDVDLDGYNTTSTGICGSVIDCNDGNANINPLAAELCSDGLDNNCNNLIDGADSVCVASLPPTITITSPSNGATIGTSSVTVVYTEGGNLTDVNHVHLILDGTEYMDLDNDGSYVFSSVSNGLHTLRVFMARVDHTQIGADRNITFTVSVSSGTGNTGNTGSTGSNSGDGAQVLVVAKKVTNDTVVDNSIEQISVSDSPTFVDVERGATEKKNIIDQYGNVYELAFEVREDGVLVKALNGDYLIPSTDIIPVLLGSTEIYMAVESVGDERARVVMGLNSNAILDEIKSNIIEGEQARTNTGFYIALAIIIVIVGAIISVIVINWRRNYISDRFLSELGNKKDK